LAEEVPMLVAENPGSGADMFWLYGPGGLPVVSITGSAVRCFGHDRLGSTRALTDGTGRVVGTYRWDPYGRPAGQTGTDTPRLGCAGRYTDPETGLGYLRARPYDPTNGRFMSRDPLVSLTREPYGYVGGDPVNRTDPWGLCWGPLCWPGEAVEWLVGRAEDFGDAYTQPGAFEAAAAAGRAGPVITVSGQACAGVCAGASMPLNPYSGSPQVEGGFGWPTVEITVSPGGPSAFNAQGGYCYGFCVGGSYSARAPYWGIGVPRGFGAGVMWKLWSSDLRCDDGDDGAKVAPGSRSFPYFMPTPEMGYYP
jgi:RHS repeat-associated protein